MPHPLLLHDYPVILTIACFVVAALVVFLTDSFAMPAEARQKYKIMRSKRRVLIESGARLVVIAWIFSLFFMISWRPIYAAQGTASFFIIFTAISRLKFIFIREPLLFSDIALVVDVFKYKTIFYATKFNVLFWIAAFAYVFGASSLYMMLEPHVLPNGERAFWIFVAMIIFIAPLALVFVKPISRLAARAAQRLLKTLKVRPDTVRFGTFTSVVLHFLVWLGMNRDVLIGNLSQTVHRVIHDLIEGEHEEAPLILIWQSESFYDLRHIGDTHLHLPTVDRLKKRAAQWGRMTSVFEGGYTLRTEFAVLSGLRPDDVHADASYPYLRAAHYSEIVWPMKLLRNGWRTHFIHPYDRTFFTRHKALPVLGFEELLMLDSFDYQLERDGPYVPDMTLTDKVIATIEEIAPETPSFLFVASMANHGPWEPGRCGELTDPVDIYRELMRQADEALGALIARLETSKRPIWLAFYGDHAPLLKSYADPFPDPRTDYFIVPLGAAHSETASPAASREEAPWNLFEAILTHAKLYKERFA
ncbi:sulfatase-like hydrolase/transferase [Shinella sp.]|uniref:LTA synthase family protein n=1 Tax=Shinella sp. TaxID=1870904 RepID=UPI002897E951|nr:sulfatase-like hydrolase/transferase [Shinella sp.]